jgi:hypothetical protein
LNDILPIGNIYKSLGWGKVFLLSPLGAMGGVLGQIIFDLCNNYTEGLLSGFLVSIIIKPLNLFSPGGVNFWSSFDIAIFLFRWILGTGSIGLSFGVALRFSAKKNLFTFITGCLIGLISWLTTGYIIGLVPSDWYSFLTVPYMVQAVLPGILTCSLLNLSIKEIRPFTFKFLLAGFLGGFLGTKLNLISTSAFIMHVPLIHIFGQNINTVRIMDAILVMFLINLISLSFLKESLKSKTSGSRDG